MVLLTLHTSLVNHVCTEKCPRRLSATKAAAALYKAASAPSFEADIVILTPAFPPAFFELTEIYFFLLYSDLLHALNFPKQNLPVIYISRFVSQTRVHSDSKTLSSPLNDVNHRTQYEAFFLRYP